MPAAFGGYLALLRRRRVAPLLCSATVARLGYGALPVVLLLLLTADRTSYAAAGAILAGYGLAAGLLGPWRARLVHRLGIVRGLLPLAIVFCAGHLAIALASPAAPFWMGVLATLTGLVAPPVGPLVRSSLQAAVGGGPDATRRAYALDTAVEEASFAVGPALAGVLVAWAGPAHALVVCVSMQLAALAVLCALLNTGAQRPVPDPIRLRMRSLSGVLSPMFVIGVLVGAFDVMSVAAVADRAGPGMAGVPTSAVALGGILGTVAYGRIRLVSRPTRHLNVLTCAAVFVAPWTVAVVLHPAVVIVLAMALGALTSPAIVAAYLAADSLAGARGGESTAWVSATLNAALSVGSAVGGRLAA